jgi:hypothetical protein
MGLVAVLAATRPSPGGAEKPPTVSIVEQRAVQMTYPDGRREFCCFELTGDPLVVKHVRGEAEGSAYVVDSRGGVKMPPPPKAVLKRTGRVPPQDVACWPISTILLDGHTLWVALEAVARPGIQCYIDMPPAPWRVLSGGDPYEGGVWQIDLAGLSHKHFTAGTGLPDDLVCRQPKDGFPLPEEIVFGPVVTAISLEGQRIVFSTRNGSRVLYIPETGIWETVRSGERETLLGLLAAKKRGVALLYAIQRLGILREKRAVPGLLDLLEAGRYDAMEALIAINDPSAEERLEALAEKPEIETRQLARAVLLGMRTPFGQPVGGLAFRLLTRENPNWAEACTTVILEIRNVSDSPRAFAYENVSLLPPQIEPHIVQADGTPVPAQPAQRGQRRLLEIARGDVGQVFGQLDFLAPGTYRVGCRVTGSAGAAEKASAVKAPPAATIWQGEVRTNEILVEILPPRSRR